MCISDPEANKEQPAASRLYRLRKKAARRTVDRLIRRTRPSARNIQGYRAAAIPEDIRRTRRRRTSIETYELGELWTYSQKTLELFEVNLDTFKKKAEATPKQ